MHRLELGRARMPIDVRSGASGLRIGMPVRRTRRDSLLGSAALLGSAIVCLGAAAIIGYIAFSVSSSNFVVALFAFLVGMFVAYLIYLRMFTRFFLWGAYTLFGWLLVEMLQDKLTVRRGVWGIRLPPFIEVRDALRVFDSVEVTLDTSERAGIALSWHEQRQVLTQRSALFGIVFLTQSQAEAVASQLSETLGLGLDGDGSGQPAPRPSPVTSNKRIERTPSALD